MQTSPLHCLILKLTRTEANQAALKLKLVSRITKDDDEGPNN